MKRITIFDEFKRSWAITVKDMKIYYLRPPALMFGILFPVALFFSFTVGRNMPSEKLISVLCAQTVFWAASSIGPVAIPMERRLRTFERFLSAPISLLSILWGKMMAGFIFGIGITSIASGIGIIWTNRVVTDIFALPIIVTSFEFRFKAGISIFWLLPLKNRNFRIFLLVSSALSTLDWWVE